MYAASWASSSLSDAKHPATAAGAHYCEDLYDTIPIGKGRHYHVADDQATFPIVQDFDQTLYPACGGRERCRHGAADSRRRSACR